MSDNYNTIKQQALNGNISQDLLPYLWEYYQDVAKPLKVQNYEEFAHAFTQYTNIPVLMPDSRVIVPVQELMVKLPHIFKHLDTKYEQATEK